MTSNFRIQLDDLSGQAICDLITFHLNDMASVSPPESCHALSVDTLKQDNISVWSVWDGEQLAGCGALMELDAQHGEIKSMRTAPAYVGQGVAAQLLQHILQVAKERSYQRLSLETGSTIEFVAARRLYDKFGFTECGPFADYIPDPLSTFMTITL
ncbi:GNAT family N-acetyltransferase [Undibacterium fentianense]|uniref:GNAT family N-acetyltransferase n=1 Tax=Undibacterium fentianense TaxID=2828728 RepID=A0A941E3X4_9BURK|nr:GNAT family N-acetyltransferase [Undibacterium fentianense]MBR7800129.1 GNAT family N-acetyltransferase [Undibacterium fentianense]